MTSDVVTGLAIDPERLWASLEETAAFGACAGGGLDRLTLGDDDKRVRDWFRAAAEAVGCAVSVDEVGNMFARRPGRRAGLAPIGIGSHLDTQPTGGRFDGILGVLAGLEILRTLEAAGHQTNAPLEVVNWTNEEGSRFAPSMLGSSVFTGVRSADFARSRRDADGVTFGEAIERIGYRGEATGAHAFEAMFELHIEQGPILDADAVAIGVVTAVQGVRWYDVTLRGTTGHTGATPMHLRRNALLGASRIVEAVERIAHEHGPDAVATVGSLDVSPNSRNVIPGAVHFTVDLRHRDDAVLAKMVTAFEDQLPSVAEALGLEHEVATVLDAPAVHFDPRLIASVEAGADEAGLTHRRLTSGAMHDAAYLARVTPTTMIFVPCRDGISHNVGEFSSPEACGNGARVLLNAVLALDASLDNGA